MTDITSPPTETFRQQYRYARDAYTQVQKDLRRVIGRDLVKLEDDLEKLGAPWTPGGCPTTARPPARSRRSRASSDR
jgi:hypothetical protein